MTDMSKEAMKLALKALEVATTPFARDRQEVLRAQAALREALASEAKEPVAWMYQCSADSSGPVLMQNKRDWAESSSGLWTETPLYKSPPTQRKPLTDEEIKSVIQSIDPAEEYLPRALQQFARAIEAAHGIKGDA